MSGEVVGPSRPPRGRAARPQVTWGAAGTLIWEIMSQAGSDWPESGTAGRRSGTTRLCGQRAAGEPLGPLGAHPLTPSQYGR